MTDSMKHEVIHRTNMVHRAAETWRPPLFARSGGRWSQAMAWLRRLLDLQAGSIWRDLQMVLPQVRGTILDVGCGAQPYRSLVSADSTYIGIDNTAVRDHFGYDVADTLYFSGDRWPIADASVNFVLCTEVLEHVQDLQQFLGEARRCLLPGGTILLTVPFAARWHFIPHDYWRFTPSALDRLLFGASFVNTRVYARGNSFTVACYKVIALLLRLAMPQTRTPFLKPALQILSIPFVPGLLLLAILAKLSFVGQGGDDCLGYTAMSEKKCQ
jgi:SAM-dependent methyltransferase